MNKNVSLAIEKAVGSISQKNQNELKNNGPKKPDLFSLSGETELFQNEKGITIKIDRSRDENLTDFGRATLTDRYLGQNESFQDLFARVASVYADDNLHAQRIYNYISNLWFMPATPVLSNGGTERGLPISCFLNEASDSLEGITNLWEENVWLAARGGGIGSYWGNLRSIIMTNCYSRIVYFSVLNDLSSKAFAKINDSLYIDLFFKDPPRVVLSKTIRVDFH